jgi:hypothetical protein
LFALSLESSDNTDVSSNVQYLYSIFVLVWLTQKCFPTRRRLRRTASPDQQAPRPRTVLGGAHLGASLRSKMRHEEAHPRSMLAVPTVSFQNVTV